jgi:hypothetical protein
VGEAEPGARRLAVATAARLGADRQRLSAANRSGREAVHRDAGDGSLRTHSVEAVERGVKQLRSVVEQLGK